MDIKDFSLSDEHKILINSGSRGCQLKYYKDNIWFKVNTSGYEALAERISSLILSCSDHPDYVDYKLCTINGRPGCYSRNFLKSEEELISFERLHFIYTGKSLTLTASSLDDAALRYKYVLDFFMDTVELDVTPYLEAILSLDYLTRNGDRHYNNLAVIKAPYGYRLAPIFDNGDSFFSSYAKFDPWLGIFECIEKSTAMPFSGSFDKQFSLIKTPIKIDYSKLLPQLNELPESRCRAAAIELLNRYEPIFRRDSAPKSTCN